MEGGGSERVRTRGGHVLAILLVLVCGSREDKPESRYIGGDSRRGYGRRILVRVFLGGLGSVCFEQDQIGGGLSDMYENTPGYRGLESSRCSRRE